MASGHIFEPICLRKEAAWPFYSAAPKWNSDHTGPCTDISFNLQFAENSVSSKLVGLYIHSGMVQLVARGPLEPKILVRVQVPEPLL